MSTTTNNNNRKKTNKTKQKETTSAMDALIEKYYTTEHTFMLAKLILLTHVQSSNLKKHISKWLSGLHLMLLPQHKSQQITLPRTRSSIDGC